jgi:hypothetical protein
VSWVFVTVTKWVVPALIFAFGFIYALRLCRRAKAPAQRLSARAGLYAGLLVLAGIIFRWPPLSVLGGNAPGLPGWVVLVILGAGLIIGFSALWLIKRYACTSIVGVIVLVIAATSTVAAYTYLFASALREPLFWAAWGITFGASLHLVLRAIHLHGQLGLGTEDEPSASKASKS